MQKLRKSLQARAGAAIAVAVLVASCGNRKADDGTPRVTVEGFPEETALVCADADTLQIPSIGLLEMNIACDMLVVSTFNPEEPWQLYSLPDIKPMGNLFSIGPGPGELHDPAPGIFASFYRRASDGHVISIVPSAAEGRFIAGDMTDRTSADTTINNTIYPTTIMAYRLDGSRWFNVDVVPDSCKLRRSIIGSDGKPMANPAVTALNMAAVKDMPEIPLLLFRPLIRPDGTMIAEVGGFKPAITVWNTSTGEHLEIVYPEMEVRKEPVQLENPMFQGGVAFDEFFAVQRLGDDGSCNIDFFGWDSKPLGTIRMDCGGYRRFDIDLKSGDLYCLDGNEDCIVRFRIADFLDSLPE